MRVRFFQLVILALLGRATRSAAQGQDVTLASNAALFAILEETLAHETSQAVLQRSCAQLGYQLNRAFLFAHSDDAQTRAWLDEKRRQLPFSRYALTRHNHQTLAIVIAMGVDVDDTSEPNADGSLNVTLTFDSELRNRFLYLLHDNGSVSVRPVAERTNRETLSLASDVVRLQVVAQTHLGTLPALTYTLAAHRDSAPQDMRDPEETLLSIRAQAAPTRRVRGISDLRRNALVAELAVARANEICGQNSLSHQTRDGAPDAYLQAHGLVSRSVGEVLALADSRSAAWEQLFASPSHRYALQQHRFTDIGIGESRASGHSCVAVLLAERPRAHVR